MNNYMTLEGKVAIVTGGASGIGHATATALAECGAAVAINYHRNETGAELLREQINSNGGRAIAIRADVTMASEIAELVHRTNSELGPVDILVNNAGSLIERLKILDITEERWDQVIDLNLKSAFLCSKAVIPGMVERRSGSIINLSSIAGRNGGALGSMHYATAKGGLITFTKGLAKELAPFNIRVNAVSPGVIDTPYHEQFSTPEMMKNYVNAIPLGRVGKADEVAKVIAFLASDAASYIAGETIEINGGMYMD
ncbi:MAG TPA: 3-oxoacyl-ACP reductase family protein [Pyrinomonadaceae bacterium]|jgi:3-oxoacyl-[acyl-carrier protein] reductase|nr:3-oxoacyl-ACP reductase family protein [Pyrinomonadaceae bacterium]